VEDVEVAGDVIALGQLLKFSGVVATGGEARVLLEEGRVLVNGEPEGRRGRKLRDGDVVQVEGAGELRVVARG
jgi:ribosome-associated protein